MTERLENQAQEVNSKKKKRSPLGEILTVGGMFIPFAQYCSNSEDYYHNIEYFLKTDPKFLYAGLVVSGIGILMSLRERYRKH
jgi:hypothetical protein